MGRFTLFLFCTLTAVVIVYPQTRGMRQADIQANQSRVALVIGNARYTDAPLRNPENDAWSVTRALKTTGFDVLTFTNLNQKALKKAIRSFGEKLSSGGVALFYYSGHGVQIRGTNYLIPIGADIAKEGDVELEGVDANYVLNEMDAAKSRVNIVILDACRDNPLPRTFRSASRGLAQMNAPMGTIIAFATSPGSVASDGTGQYGLYTQELVKNIAVPGLPIETVFKRTLSGVKQQSSGNQIPWTSYSIEGDFYFIPPTEQEFAADAAQPKNGNQKPSGDAQKSIPDAVTKKSVPPPSESKSNFALQFDQNGGYLELRPSSVLQPQNLTLELWVKFDFLNSAFIPLVEEKDTDHRTNANGYSLQFEQGKIMFRLAKASDMGVSASKQYSPGLGTWVHVAGTYDGYEMRLYINGELAGSTPFAGPAYYGSRNILLGVGQHWSFGGSKHFRGQMDELRIWNVARTQEEIKSDFGRRLTGSEPGLAGYWSFDQNTNEGYMLDQSIYHNHALIWGGVSLVPSDVFR